MGHREELTRFLKAVRGRIDPESVGLPKRDRRREKGLSRDEVALLSGMSVTWYTWFEQGRDVQLSATTLERLSGALRLDPREREFLFTLAQHRPPPLTGERNEEISTGLQQMMDCLNIPALVMAEDWRVIGWNALVTRVFRDYGALPPEQRNLFKILLLTDIYRTDEAEYDALVRRLTARLKWDYSRATQVDLFDQLIEEMKECSPLFRTYWGTPEISAEFEGPNAMPVEGLGKLSFYHTSYAVEHDPGQRLVLFTPSNEATAEKLRGIVAALGKG